MCKLYIIFVQIFGKINRHDMLEHYENRFSCPELLGLTPLYPGTSELYSYIASFIITLNI